MSIYIKGLELPKDKCLAVIIWPNGFVERLNNSEENWQALPAADVSPVRHGKWIDFLDPWDREHRGKCSECGKRYSDYMYFRFCPNCGADMREKES